MKPVPFEYHRPASLAETFDLLDRYGDDGRLLAGGQDPAHGLDRPYQGEDERDEGDQPAQGESAAADGQRAAEKHGGHREVGDQVHQRPPDTAQPHQLEGRPP